MTILIHDLKPTLDDGIITDTSEEQRQVEETISELVQEVKAKNSATSLELFRDLHTSYLASFLRPLPHQFTALDASRPWILYWNLHAFGLLDYELSPKDARRAISSLVHCRPSPSSALGGFGGGSGQRPHLATTYAAVMALAYVGDEESWAQGAGVIDRRSMHDWLLSLKQPDGSFIMHQGGEVDVRGCYCALTVATLLNILTPDLTRGTAAFVASCQTYEGGLASAAYTYSPSSTCRPALGEAHGGYAFCALASYSLLPTSSSDAESSSLDLPLLMGWFSTMQAIPIEGGGFRGRTNKLVDGCYSWWCGGLGALLQGMLAQEGFESKDSLFDRDALQEYILIAAQAPKGGLRDKPGRNPDGYHTCYNLSGLSAAQHLLRYSPSQSHQIATSFIEGDHTSMELIKGSNESDEEARLRMRAVYAHALAWTEDVESKRIIGLEANEVLPTHPVFNITLDRSRRMLDFFYQQPPLITS